MKKSVSARYSHVSESRRCGGITVYANVFEILQEVRDGLPLVLGEHILVEGLAGFAWTLSASPIGGSEVSYATVPPQQVELQMPMTVNRKKVL